MGTVKDFIKQSWAETGGSLEIQHWNEGFSFSTHTRGAITPGQNPQIQKQQSACYWLYAGLTGLCAFPI